MKYLLMVCVDESVEVRGDGLTLAARRRCRRAPSAFRAMPPARIRALTTKYIGSMSSAFSECSTIVWIGKITAQASR